MLAPVGPRMQAAGLQCLKLQIAVAFPDPQTRAFPGAQFSRKTRSAKYYPAPGKAIAQLGSASERARGWGAVWVESGHVAQYYDDMLLARLGAANLLTKILDFRGFASSIILILRVEFSCPKGIFRKLRVKQY